MVGTKGCYAAFGPHGVRSGGGVVGGGVSHHKLLQLPLSQPPPPQQQQHHHHPLWLWHPQRTVGGGVLHAATTETSTTGASSSSSSSGNSDGGSSHSNSSSSTSHGQNQHRRARQTPPASSEETERNHRLLDEYTTYRGELVNPYEVLKISRHASLSEIKQSYRNLSRRYHPDGNRHKRDILPGSCNNWDEVRDHWERINLSYKILSNPTRRKRYDRRVALADPGEALKRAAVDAAWSGMSHVGKGIFSMGAFALQQMTKGYSTEHRNNGNRITTREDGDSPSGDV